MNRPPWQNEDGSDAGCLTVVLRGLGCVGAGLLYLLGIGALCAFCLWQFHLIF